MKTKLFAPAYYKNFACIADKCTHSCCIGWEIDVDEGALEKYELLTHPYGKAIMDSIDYEDTPHFRLCSEERCPHLDKGGLCNIIKELGESYLCEICAEHPRFYNDTCSGKEVGLGMACEEACRIVLESDLYGEIVEIGELPMESPCPDFDPIPYRTEIYKLLSSRSIPYSERLEKIYAKFGVSPACLSDDEWHTVISELELLDEKNRSLFASYTSSTQTPSELDAYLERALAYFVYRHVTGSIDESDLACRLGFCLFCERLLCSVCKSSAKDILLLARTVSEEIEYSTDNTERIAEMF